MTAAARLPPLDWPFQGAEEEELGPAEGADQQGGDSHAHDLTHKLLHTDAFTHRNSCTYRPFYTDTFSHRCFYTQKLLHTEAIAHKNFYTQ